MKNWSKIKHNEDNINDSRYCITTTIIVKIPKYLLGTIINCNRRRQKKICHRLIRPDVKFLEKLLKCDMSVSKKIRIM